MLRYQSIRQGAGSGTAHLRGTPAVGVTEAQAFRGGNNPLGARATEGQEWGPEPVRMAKDGEVGEDRHGKVGFNLVERQNIFSW